MSGSCPQPTDTGQTNNNNFENASSQQAIETNDFSNNCISYGDSLNNRLSNNLDQDLDDIDSTDELEDIDDLKGVDNGYIDCSNLTGIANNAAMFIEDDKRKRRAIANSNERRRMQSINAGFQTLKSLIPHSSGEKLSKACILQRSADFMQFLSNEKDKLSNKLQVALKILDANGLISQFETDQFNSGNNNTSNSSSCSKKNSLNFTKSATSTKINKQYVSSYTGSSASSNGSSASITTIQPPVCTPSSILSTALLTESDISISSYPQISKVSKISAYDDEDVSPPTNLVSLEPIQVKTLTTKLTRTNLEHLDTVNNGSEQTIAEAKLIKPILVTPIITECNTPEAGNGGVHKIEPANIIINSNQLNTIEIQPLTIGLHQIKSLPEANLKQRTDSSSSSNSLFMSNILVSNSEPIQFEIGNEHIQSQVVQRTEEPEPEHKKLEPNMNKIAGFELTTESLLSLLNDIKGQNHNIDINSCTNLILKSILSSNIILPSSPAETISPETTINISEIAYPKSDSNKKKENTTDTIIDNNSITVINTQQKYEDDLNIETSNPISFQTQQPVQVNNNLKKVSNQPHLETNILIASSKINQEKLLDTKGVLTKVCKNRENTQIANNCHNLTNIHLKNASLINKSSRSNSIDQLIAAAAVTANSSTCMSPLSPSNSPTGMTKLSHDQISHDLDSNELNVSRKNLNTIVEAIFHVEGTSRLDEVMIDQDSFSKYQNSLPSSSCTASNSSGCAIPEVNQIKPPKKRKYTTEDITQTLEDQIATSTPTKQSSQFISDYYNKSAAKHEQCQSINKLLANKAIHSSVNENLAPKSGSTRVSLDNSTEIEQINARKSENPQSNNNNKKKSSSNLLGLIVTS